MSAVWWTISGNSRAIVASMVVHAGIFVGVAVAPRHALDTALPNAAETKLEFDVVATNVLDQEHQEKAPAGVATPAHHHHDYPVPLSHDATPHDPHLEHPHGALPSASVPVAAPPLAETTPDDHLPTFALSSGSLTAPPGPTVSARAHSGLEPTFAGLDSRPTSSDESALSPAQVSQLARALHPLSPHYPDSARQNEIEADVQLEIVVSAEGSVAAARVLKHAGYGFDEAALEAVRHGQFAPALRQGKAVRVRMPWTIQFRLR